MSFALEYQLRQRDAELSACHLDLSRLRSEVEALRKDACRYQWLRGRVPGSAYRIMGVIYSEGGEGVDAAIDAAMGEKS